jgi:hypothetical protein
LRPCRVFRAKARLAFRNGHSYRGSFGFRRQES